MLKKLKKLKIISSPLLLVLLLSASFFTASKKVSAYANVVHLNACGTLSSANTTYILDNDVSSTATCFTVTASNVELDLNNKTVTYDTFAGTGFSDAGFEGGSGATLDSSWTVSQPTQNTIVRESNSTKTMVGSWHMYWGNAENNSSVTSPWSNLPINPGTSNNATTYILRGDHDWAYTGGAPLFNMTVQYKDLQGNISTVISTDFTNTQQFDFPTRQTDGQYRSILTLKDGHGFVNAYGEHPFFDEFNMAPLGKYGIASSYNTNVNIHGGTVLQGAAHSFKGHAVNIYAVTNVTVSNIYTDSVGWQAAGIYSNYTTTVHIDDNEVHTHNPYVHNRAQVSAAVSVGGASDYYITNNNIYAGSGWGALYVSGTDKADISGNELYTNSTITNHFALGGGMTTNMKIFDNIIDANPGQGISSGGDGNEIYNNTITLHGQEPNLEYGYIEFDAIKLNDYFGGTNKNLYVHDNIINLFGNINRYYSPDPRPDPLPENINGNTTYTAIMNGISNIASGGNVRFSHNTITARSVDKEVKLNGISPGGAGPVVGLEVVFDHNIIDSDVTNIELGGYAGQGNQVGNVKFYSNTFIKGSTANEYYHTIGMGRTGNITKDLMRFVDTDLQNGASLTDIDLKTDYGRFSYWADWYLNIAVRDGALNPVSGAQIMVKDKNDAVVFDGLSDAGGNSGRLTIDQLQHIGSGILDQSNITQFSPHTVTVTYPDSTQKTETLTMDKSKNVTFVKGSTSQFADATTLTLATDTIAPTFNNITPTPGTRAWDQNNFTFSIKTGEVATCKYSTSAGVSYANMANQFDSVDGIIQTKALNLPTGATYNYYVLCKDGAGNVSLDPYLITYNVAASPVGDTMAPTAPSGLNVL